MIDTEREAYYKIINTIYKETGYDPKKIKPEYINNYIRAGKILDSLSVGNPDDGKTKAERYNEEYNSKFKFGPGTVVAMVIVVIAFVAGLRIFL